MTREEAANILQNDIIDGHVEGNARFMDAFWFAVDNLKAEPCEDAVKREAVLNTLDTMDKALDEDRTVEAYKELLKECYKALSPVTPKPTECEDAVSREAALKAIEGKEYQFQVYEAIEKLPPVTPKQRTGRWIKTIGENGVTSAVRCSECGFEDNRYMLFRYCPNCGAKMEGDSE